MQNRSEEIDRFKRKMIFFVLLANMECCYQPVKILEETIRNTQPLNFQYFSFYVV